MAAFVGRCQLPSGAIFGGTVRVERQVPVAFNTAMALLGFSAAYRETGSPVLGDHIRKAAEFLVGDIAPSGHFRSHGPFVYRGPIKTYTSMCAWPLYLAGQDSGREEYGAAAFRVADAVLRQQHDNGWFANNCLSGRTDSPLLHTIAYTLQGLLESGLPAAAALTWTRRSAVLKGSCRSAYWASFMGGGTRTGSPPRSGRA